MRGSCDRPLAAAVACLLLAGCGGGPALVDNPLECFPEAARPWIHISGAAEAGSPTPEASGARSNATIYVDRSGSMVGYLAGSTEVERPFQDLVRLMPGMLNPQNFTSQYRAFGTQITPALSAEQQNGLLQPAFYSCEGAQPGQCDNRESHLDRLFAEIARSRDGLSIVISDLWFSNSDVQTSALSALAEPLTHILSDGRTIAIYGIPAPFRGRIFDMPFAQAPVQFQGRHPLFLIAVGSAEQVAQLHHAMQTAPSPFLREGVRDGRVKRTLFTLAPAVRSEALAAPLQGGQGGGISQSPVIEVRENLRLQQFSIDYDQAMRGGEGLPPPPRWTGPAAGSFLRDAVWEGEFRPRTRVWERRGQSCTEEDWIEAAPIEGLWSGTGSAQQFVLNPETVAAELAREGTYLIAGELERTALRTPNPASSWMTQWGFLPGDANPVRQGADGAPFFPTLHLSEVSQLLEGALSAAAQRQRRPLVGFAVAVKLER